jgi:hypothetical protein
VQYVPLEHDCRAIDKMAMIVKIRAVFFIWGKVMLIQIHKSCRDFKDQLFLPCRALQFFQFVKISEHAKIAQVFDSRVQDLMPALKLNDLYILRGQV